MQLTNKRSTVVLGLHMHSGCNCPICSNSVTWHSCVITPNNFNFSPSSVWKVDCIWNVMAHAQKPDFVLCRNGRVHLNRQGRQFSRLLAAEVCASALVMLETPWSKVVWEYWLPTPFASFPFTSPPVHHRVPSGFKLYLFLSYKLIFNILPVGFNISWFQFCCLGSCKNWLP